MFLKHTIMFYKQEYDDGSNPLLIQEFERHKTL